MKQFNFAEFLKISNLVKDNLSLFSLNELKTLEDKIITKTNNKTAKPTYLGLFLFIYAVICKKHQFLRRWQNVKNYLNKFL